MKSTVITGIRTVIIHPRPEKKVSFETECKIIACLDSLNLNGKSPIILIFLEFFSEIKKSVKYKDMKSNFSSCIVQKM